MNTRDYEMISKARLLIMKEDKLQEGINIFDSLSKKKNRYALYELGKLYKEGKYVKKDEEAAVNLLIYSGELGYEKAYYELGLLFLEKRKYEKARRYFEKSKLLAESLLELGRMYYYGLGSSISHHKAFLSYLEAAKKGSSKALYMIGYQYMFGDGIKQNIKKGTSCLIKASIKHVPDSLNIYSKINKEIKL